MRQNFHRAPIHPDLPKSIIQQILLWCNHPHNLLFHSVLLEAFVLCKPVSYNWDKTIPGGRCANENLAYLLAGITNLLIDAIVVILPIPMLWRLQMPLCKKLGVVGMFGLGAM